MIQRENGTNPMLECRHDSHEQTDKQKRRKEILSIMRNEEVPMTAMEIASELFTHGFVNMLDRNNASPRLTEMCKDGTVEPTGKKKCKFTGRTVTCFQIRSAE